MRFENVYMKCADGTETTFPISLKEEETNGVKAVWIHGGSRKPLNEEFGAGIDIVIEDVKSWMADYRYGDFWCQPAFGTNINTVPDETQGFVYLKKNGTYGVILPVVSEKYKCVLCGGENGVLTARLFSWKEGIINIDALAFLCAEGDNPFKLMEQCAKRGLELLGNGCRSRDERRYPEIFEYLGWCSWDAFGIRVNEDGLLKKCEELKEKEIPVQWVLLDDMWGDVRAFWDMEFTHEEMYDLMKTGMLYSFEADPRRFPDGLKGCIDKIKEYGLKVGIWHPTTGYWRGIDPDGEICRDFKQCLCPMPSGGFVHGYEQDKSYMFYSAYHKHLRQCGAEFAKIDNQSMTERFYKNQAPVGQVARSFHDGMEASVGQHFDNCMINCMGMASEDMWNRSVSPISRCSNDFLPENKEWFTQHILQCSFNSLVQGQFYWNDWDMWWTDDAQAVKNSVLRAISGGPIYVSDKLNRSKKDILMPLVFEDGRILRCDRPAMPTADCLTENPIVNQKPFKLHNICGQSGVMAVFNLDERERRVDGSWKVADIPELQGEEFAVYEHFSGTLQILKRNEVMKLSLKNRDDIRLFVVVPYENGFAPIGRIDKFISPKSIKGVYGREIELVEDGPCACVIDGQLTMLKRRTK